MLKRICLYVALPIFTAIGLIGALPGPTAYAQGEKYELSSDKLTLTGSSGNFEYVFGQFSNEVKFTSLGSSGYAQNSGMLVFYYEGKPDNLGQTCGNTQGAYVEVHINTKTNKTTQVLAACGKQSEQGRTKILPEGDAYNIWDQAASVSYTAPPSGSGSNSGQSPANISGTPTYTFDESSKDGSKIKACGGFYKQFGSDCVVFSQISSSSTSAAVSKVGNGSVALYSYNHTIPGKNQPCQAQVSLAISSTDRSLDSGSLDGWVGYMLNQGGVDITDEITANKAGCNLQRPTDKAKWENSPGLPIKVAGADKLESFLGGSVESSGDGEKTCGTEVTMVGWLVCPITNAGLAFADTIWGIFEGLLKTDPLKQTGGNDNGIYYNTWVNVRNIANVLFVLVLLLVIFSQITNTGLNNYSIKKMLPRMIVVAIAMNLSFFIVQIAVDLANILGGTILDIFNRVAEVDSGKLNWQGLMQEIISVGVGGAGLIAGVGIASSAGLAGPLIILLLLLLIPAVVGILAGFLTLLIRSALIPIIAIFAPLAFVAYIFPNGQSLFDKWRKTFTALLLLYPLSAIYYGALKFTAVIMINGQGVLERMVGHTLLFMGCFVVLGLALKGNAITGKMFGAIQGGINKVAVPAQKLGMGVFGATAAMRFAKFKTNPGGGGKYARKAGFMGRHTMARGIGKVLGGADRSKWAREQGLAVAKADQQQSFQQWAVSNDGAEKFANKSGIDSSSTTGRAYMTDLNNKAIKNVEANMSTASIDQLKKALIDAANSGDTISATAAQNILLGSRGNAGANAVRESADSITNATSSQALRENIITGHSGIKSSNADIMAWATSTSSESMATVGNNSKTWKMSNAEFMQQSAPAQTIAISNGSVSRDQLASIYNSPELRDSIKPDVLASFQKAAASVKTPTI